MSDTGNITSQVMKEKLPEMSEKQPDLLRCPFCGSQAVLQTAEVCGYFVTCTNFDCQTIKSAETKTATLMKWNRRNASDKAAIRELVEAVERSIPYLEASQRTADYEVMSLTKAKALIAKHKGA